MTTCGGGPQRAIYFGCGRTPGDREIASVSPTVGADARPWLALTRPLAGGLKKGRTASPVFVGAGIRATGHGGGGGGGGGGGKGRKETKKVSLAKRRPVVAASYLGRQPSQQRNVNRGSLLRDARCELVCPRRAGRDPNSDVAFGRLGPC